jgi:hypothetical protein
MGANRLSRYFGTGISAQRNRIANQPEKLREVGTEDYSKAVKRYDQYASKYSDLVTGAAEDVKGGINEAKGLRDYYKPGGGYGKGLKAEAKETVDAGEAKALGSAVSSGMSSNFATRGINVLAAAEKSKLYANIDDTRNQLLMSAFQPYAQMIQTLGSLAGTGGNILNAAPRRSSYVSNTTAPQSSRMGTF